MQSLLCARKTNAVIKHWTLFIHFHKSKMKISIWKHIWTLRAAAFVLLSPQHPVDGLALIGSQHGDEARVLDIEALLCCFCLVQVSDVIVQLLDVLTLQISVTLLLFIHHHLYHWPEIRNPIGITLNHKGRSQFIKINWNDLKVCLRKDSLLFYEK